VDRKAGRPFERGDRFETTQDVKVTALTHWRAPATFGFDASLPSGLVVVALKGAGEDWQSYPGLPAVPEDYEVWEQRLVPRSDLALRNEPRGYDGFHLSFVVEDIGTTLRRLPGKAEPAFRW
jgi:hypothetical protein